LSLREEVQALIDAGDWAGLARYYGIPLPDAPTADWRIWLLVAAVFCLLWQIARLRKRRKPGIQWKLGKVTADLGEGDHSRHAVVAGTSELGKSSAVTGLLALDNPLVAVCFDVSKPFEKWWSTYVGDPNWIMWTPTGTVKWDVLQGSPLSVAECLTAGFARTDADTGYFRGLARNRLQKLIEEDDASGTARDLWRYVDLLRVPQPDGDSTRACKRWAGSFETLLMAAGNTIGPGGFDLTSAMRAGKKVLFMPDRFTSPETAPMFAGMALVQARRAASEAGNFIIVVEEAGQAVGRDVEVNALAQAGRTRGCPLIVITQNAHMLEKPVLNNVKVWVGFGQETKEELRAMAEHLWIEPDELRGLPVGTCWVRAPGVKPTKVKLPLLKPRKPAVALPDKRVAAAGYPQEQVGPKALPEPRFRVVEVEPEPEVEPVPEWVGNWENRLRAWKWLERQDEPAMLWTPERGWWEDVPCLLWKGTPKAPRPMMKLDGKEHRVYRLTYVWAGGTIPESYQVDHLCNVPKCCEPRHLEAVSNEENSRRRDGRKAAQARLESAA